MINIYSFILFAYVTLRLIVPLPLGFAGKIGAGLLVLLISLKHFFFQNFFGGLAAPDLPRFAILAAGWLYVTLAFIFILLVIRDIAGCLIWVINRAGYAVNLPILSGPVSAGIVILSLIGSTFGLYEAVRHPDVKKTEVTLTRLPQELDGLTIVQITDLHVNTFNPEHKIQKIVETINGLKPDLIVLTGDIVDGTTIKREADIAPLQGLRAKYGVFGSAGNHEYYSGFNAWKKRFAELGIHMLYNDHTTLSIHGKPLVIAGITDTVAAQFKKPVPNIAKALEGAPHDAIRILMAHRPHDAEVHANAGVDLQLSGHTHGGQIIGFNQVVARFNENRLMGWYNIGKMKLYISTGISLWNGFPVRLGVPSEIAVITLRAG